jgi:hypothetical protein
MPTRKQRRRRQKDRRHEWEEVYVDAEGRELAPEEVEELAPEMIAAKREPGARAARSGARQQGGRPARAGRTVQPPSWRRVAKRAAIFAPLMYVFITLTNRGTNPAYALLITLQLILLFIPFSYLMDRLTYRLWQKRQARPS